MVDVKQLQEKLQEIAKLPKEEQANAADMLTEEEIEFLQKQQSASGGKQQCIFCGIVNRQIPTRILYEDDFVMAFLEKNPASPGHTLVIPKEHYEVLPQVPSDRAALLMNTVKVLTGAVFDAVNAQGVTVLQRNGVAAEQVIPHVHFHIIPRFENDKLNLREWKPVKLEEEQFEEIQKRIIEKAKGKAEKKVVYDTSGMPIEEKGKKETKAEEKPKKEKLIRIKPRIP